MTSFVPPSLAPKHREEHVYIPIRSDGIKTKRGRWEASRQRYVRGRDSDRRLGELIYPERLVKSVRSISATQTIPRGAAYGEILKAN